jgi:hypothetical protein
MAANVFVFLFSGLLVGLLYYFRLRRAATKAEVGRLAMVCAFIGVFFLVNALFAQLGRSALLVAADTSPVLSLDVLEAVETGAPVILDGIVSLENPTYIENYVGYIECNDDACTRYVPSSLLIRLDGGDVAVRNGDFEDRGWPYASDGILFLAPGDPVIVVGEMERGVTILGPDEGKETFSIRADIVYAGSREDFVARAEARVILPTIMLIVNLVAVAVVLLLPWAGWYLRPRGTAGV